MKLAEIKVARWSGANVPAPAVIRNGIPVPLSRDELESTLVGALAEVERLQEELKDGDYWMKRSTDCYESGMCPVCFATDEAGHTKGCLWGRAEAKIERLQAVMDAADAFLADPPEDMHDRMPFNQQTTAGDCRVLSKAYHKLLRQRRRSDE